MELEDTPRAPQPLASPDSPSSLKLQTVNPIVIPHAKTFNKLYIIIPLTLLLITALLIFTVKSLFW